MRVILKQEIKGVGKADDVVNVAPGYARNYLFPRRLAVEATDQQMRERQKRHEAIERKGDRAISGAAEISEKLSQIAITIHAKAGAGTKLYGSVTPQDIADAIKEQTGIEIDKRKIHIQEPIKSAGRHAVPIRPHRDVGFDLNVEVVTD